MGQLHDAEHTPETCRECLKNRAEGTITVHYWEPIEVTEDSIGGILLDSYRAREVKD